MAKTSSDSYARGRGAIFTIAVLLFSSAVLRIGGDAGQAVAQALTQPMTPSTGPKGVPDTTKTDAKPAMTVSIGRAEVGSLLGALQERERRVEALEAQVNVRRKALEVADEEIRRRLDYLEQAEVNLKRTLALADGAAEADLARLTTVYENMKPKNAAALFATMEADFAAGFLGRMRPDAAAAIMAGLPPDIAYSISAILAGRNANVPKT